MMADSTQSPASTQSRDLFTGLSAFPLTPLRDDRVDETSFAAIVRRVAQAKVESITASGSTGSYAYLSTAERARVAHLAVENAGGVPVFVGVGALRTSQILAHIRDAEKAGAAAVLLAPMTYQPLTDDDVLELFRAATDQSDLPVIVYDNPGTTHFSFSLDLYARIAELPGIASIKIPPGAAPSSGELGTRVAAIRDVVPKNVTIGISGDPAAAYGLNAGCDAWYSVIGGTLPDTALRITRAAQSSSPAEAVAESDRLAPLWGLFSDLGGSNRVIAAIAEHLGLAPRGCLPLPIQGLDDVQRARVHQVVEALELR